PSGPLAQPANCNASLRRLERGTVGSPGGARTASSQPVDANSLGWGLEEDTSPQLQVLVDASLDRVADIVRQRHHEVLVFGGLEREMSDLHRRMELDPPFARQR